MTQPLAYVHPDAKIANNVVIEPFTTIARDVVIGEGTWIGPNVTIMDGARIGKNCRIFPGSVISGVPQDLKFNGEVTTAEIGDNTTIRECVTINRGTIDKYKTKVGKDCLIMAYCHVAHDCVLGDGVILANSTQLAGHVEIGDNARFGGGTLVHQFCKIGAHTMVGGGVFVRKDVPPFVKAVREPLSYMGVNSVGLRRSGVSTEKITEIQEIYRTIFLKGLNLSAALELIEREFDPTTERDMILDFLKKSERGIIKGQ